MAITSRNKPAGAWTALAAASTVFALLGAACSSQVSREAGAPEYKYSSLSQVAALPSLAPQAGLEDGGGGLTGGVWQVYGMEGAEGGNDPGIPANLLPQASTGGVNVKFTAQTSQAPYQWQVYDLADPQAFTKPPLWDSGAVTGSAGKGAKKGQAKKSASTGNDANNCAASTVSPSEASCVIPADKLRVGGTYAVYTTTHPGGGGGVQTKRVFAVNDTEAVSGSTTAEVPAENIHTMFGDYGIGLRFNDTALGVSNATRALGGFTQGLPPGWSFSGVGSGIDSVTLAGLGQGGYQGYAKVLTLHQGPMATVLGCATQKSGTLCTPMGGNSPGGSYMAFIPNSGDGSITVKGTDGTDSTFDSSGRLATEEKAGQYPLKLSYREVAGKQVFDNVAYQDLSWTFYYPGDKQCDDSSLPAGFAQTPSGYVCAIVQPNGDWWRMSYTTPAGGAHPPRLSRVSRLPESCQWNPGDCGLDNETTDFGWNDINRPFLTRAPNFLIPVMAGSRTTGYDVSQQATLDQAMADPTLQTMAFDPNGRISSTVSAASLEGGGRLTSSRQYLESDAVAKQFGNQFAGATRTVTMATAGLLPLSAGGGPDPGVSPQSITRGYDDAGRGLYVLEPIRPIQEAVWHPLVMGGPIAHVQGSQLSAGVYDIRGRQTGAYVGDVQAFNRATCSAASPQQVTFDSCAPTDPKRVTAQTYTYDQVGAGAANSGDVGNGLLYQWYDNPSFSQPAGPFAVAQWEHPSGQPVGFALTPPSGVGNQYSLLFNGGFILPKGDWAISVTVPDPDVQGMLKIDNKTCQIYNKQASGCQIDNSNSKGATFTTGTVQFVLALSRTADTQAVPGVIHVAFSDQDSGDDLSMSSQRFTQRYGVVTETSSTDPVLDGDGKILSDPYTNTSYAFYTDPNTAEATTLTSVGTSPDYPGVLAGGTCQGNPGPCRSQNVYQAGPFGKAREVKKISPTGAYQMTMSYWGDTETPGDAQRSGQFTNMGEIDDRYLDVPQRGMLKTLTTADGISKSFVYDGFGGPVYTQTAAGTQDPQAHWNYRERDDMYHMVKEVIKGRDGQADIENTYDYQLGTTPGTPVLTGTLTTRTKHPDGSDDTQTQIVESAANGLELSYQDAWGTKTANTYDTSGLLLTAATTAAPLQGVEYNPAVMGYQYNEYGSPTTISINQKPAAAISYLPPGSDKAGGIDSVTYPSFGGISMQIGRSATGTQNSATWTLADGKIQDKVSSSLSGKVVAASFAGLDMDFKYDGLGALQWADIAGNQFTYAYDDEGQRSCAAYSIPNPDGAKPCSALSGSYTYTFANQRPVATTNPKTVLPSDQNEAFTPLGTIKRLTDSSLGTTSDFTYDARGMLISERESNPNTIAPVGSTVYRRDHAGRVLEQHWVATSGAPAPTTTAAQPAREAAAPSPASVDQVTRNGYTSSSADTAMVVYGDSGPIVQMALPGGLQFTGSLGTISSVTGLGSIDVDLSTGAIGVFTPMTTGPFQETEKTNLATVNPADNPPGQPTKAMGVRSFHPELGLTLQRDPLLVGGEPPYQVAKADPINQYDPTGLTSESKKKKQMPWWLQMGISMFIDALGILATGMLANAIYFERDWFKGLNMYAQRFILFTTYSFINIGLSMLSAGFTSNWDLKKVWGSTWVADEIMAIVSGYVGAYTASIDMALRGLIEKAGKLIDSVPKMFEEAKELQVSLGKKMQASVEKYAEEYLEELQTYEGEIAKGIEGFGKVVGEALDRATANAADLLDGAKGLVEKKIEEGITAGVGQKFSDALTFRKTSKKTIADRNKAFTEAWNEKLGPKVRERNKMLTPKQGPSLLFGANRKRAEIAPEEYFDFVEDDQKDIEWDMQFAEDQKLLLLEEAGDIQIFVPKKKQQ